MCLFFTRRGQPAPEHAEHHHGGIRRDARHLVGLLVRFDLVLAEFAVADGTLRHAPAVPAVPLRAAAPHVQRLLPMPLPLDLAQGRVDLLPRHRLVHLVRRVAALLEFRVQPQRHNQRRAVCRCRCVQRHDRALRGAHLAEQHPRGGRGLRRHRRRHAAVGTRQAQRRRRRRWGRWERGRRRLPHAHAHAHLQQHAWDQRCGVPKPSHDTDQRRPEPTRVQPLPHGATRGVPAAEACRLRAARGVQHTPCERAHRGALSAAVWHAGSNRQPGVLVRPRRRVLRRLGRSRACVLRGDRRARHAVARIHAATLTQHQFLWCLQWQSVQQHQS
eukprot:PhM_4_TR10353/c1_g1_i1/m.80243